MYGRDERIRTYPTKAALNRALVQFRVSGRGFRQTGPLAIRVDPSPAPQNIRGADGFVHRNYSCEKSIRRALIGFRRDGRIAMPCEIHRHCLRLQEGHSKNSNACYMKAADPADTPEVFLCYGMIVRIVRGPHKNLSGIITTINDGAGTATLAIGLLSKKLLVECKQEDLRLDNRPVRPV